MSTKFDVVAHADWGKARAKRWYTLARLVDGRYVAEMAKPAYETARWFADLRDLGETLFLGVDFPLGVPLSYAGKIGAEDFVEFLGWLKQEKWASFFEVAASADQITLHRPFYPQRPGGTKRQHLTDALGFESADQLFRMTDRATINRRAAAPMFWTMGAQQVGKQMLTGWQELILPHLEELELWPLDLRGSTFAKGGTSWIAECYPSEFYHQLNIQLGKGGKGSQTARMQCAGALLEWSMQNEIIISDQLREQISTGFPNDDAFDATVGLFGMLNVLLNDRPTMPNLPEKIRKIEGWVFGQTDLPR